MRIFSSLVLLSCVVFLGARGEGPNDGAGPESRFEGAVDAFRVGDLESAQTLFSSLLNEGLSQKDRGLVYFNLGNIAFRGDRFLESVAYYTAAIQGLGRNDDLWHNLELARSRAGLAPADDGGLAATVRSVLALPSNRELESLGWLLLALLGLSLVVEIYQGSSFLRLLAALLVLFFWGDLGLLHMRAQAVLDSPAMVIAPEGAALHSEPRPDLQTGVQLAPGEIVEVIDRIGQPGRVGTWIKISTEGGAGWLNASQALVF